MIQCKRAYDAASPDDGHRVLIYSAKDPEHNNAVVLLEWLEDELDKQGAQSSPVCYLDSL
jgi:uncharacterized protein YeaO (DUF488 family)